MKRFLEESGTNVAGPGQVVQTPTRIGWARWREKYLGISSPACRQFIGNIAADAVKS